MKVLVADESGMWVLSKRLDRGTFAWPAFAADVVKIEYRPQQLPRPPRTRTTTRRTSHWRPRHGRSRRRGAGFSGISVSFCIAANHQEA